MVSIVGYPATGASDAKGVCHGIVAYPLNTPLSLDTFLQWVNLYAAPCILDMGPWEPGGSKGSADPPKCLEGPALATGAALATGPALTSTMLF